MAARWAAARASTRLERRLVARRTARRRDRRCAATYTTARRHRRRPRGASTPARRRRDQRRARRVDDSRRRWPTSPRVGTVLEVVAGLEQARAGSGPARTRRTRIASAAGCVGAGASTVTDQYVPYIRPQENGGHADVRWLDLTDGDGTRPPDRARPPAPGLGHARPRRRPRRHHPRRRTLVPRAETIVHLDAAHRGLGTASCGPDTLPEYLLGPGTYRWAWTLRDIAVRPDRCRSAGRAERREFHLHNDRISYVMRVHENGALGHLHFGGPPGRGSRRSPTSKPGGFAGFSNRVGDPVALEYPTTGSGDHRIPALTVELADGSTVLDLAYVEHRIVAGKPERDAADRLPATYVEVGRRGGHARDRPRRRAERPRGRALVHDLRATGRSSPGAPGSATTAPRRSA